MYGVSKLTIDENLMMISYGDADGAFFAQTLNRLADAGVVVDMISQTAPYGRGIRFSFTASYNDFDTALKALGGAGQNANPMVSGGYAKVNLYGEDMVESVGVAARALNALGAEEIEVALITTSDLDISILLRQEDIDVATALLRNAFAL
ncbi:ACT domain-containing protein [Ruminococcaceae bacterium OttesenSCG-928-O06]|nr:ACT domain-containing protein [Ruminococcaceae bacterium OttesenSCG-928-O06]